MYNVYYINYYGNYNLNYYRNKCGNKKPFKIKGSMCKKRLAIKKKN